MLKHSKPFTIKARDRVGEAEVTFIKIESDMYLAQVECRGRWVRSESGAVKYPHNFLVRVTRSLAANVWWNHYAIVRTLEGKAINEKRTYASFEQVATSLVGHAGGWSDLTESEKESLERRKLLAKLTDEQKAAWRALKPRPPLAEWAAAELVL